MDDYLNPSTQQELEESSQAMPAEQAPQVVAPPAPQLEPTHQPGPVTVPAPSQRLDDVPVIGRDLEAALRERKRAAADQPVGALWEFNGETFRLRKDLPGSVMLAGLETDEADSESEAIKMAMTSLKKLFVDDDGKKIVRAMIDADADLPYIEGLFREIMEYFTNRPLDNSAS